MKASRLLIASLGSLLFVGTAAAQDPDPNAAPTGDAPAGDGSTDPNAAPAVPDPAAGAATVSSRWPRAVIARPLTMPKGIVMPELDVGTFTSSFFDPAILRLAIGYGVTDDLELGFAGYTFTTDDAGKGSIDANIGYKLARGAAGGKLEVIGRVQVGYALAGKVDLTTGDTEGAVKPVGLGVHVQYNVTDKIAVITPGQQLQIGVEDPQPIALGLPVALGFQATPELYAQLDTTLATIELKDSDTTVIFSDTTPLALTGIYNVMPALDVFASLALDASADEVGDSLALTVGARYYAGKL